MFIRSTFCNLNGIFIGRLLGLFLMVFCVYSHAQIEIQKKWHPKTPFTSELVEYSWANPAAQNKFLIQIGREGYRVESIASGRSEVTQVYIQNFLTHKEWLADPSKLYYMQVVKPSKSLDIPQKEAFVVGVLAHRPCQGARKQKITERRLGGHSLIKWKCWLKGKQEKQKKDKIYFQHYSTLLGIVVRQETEDGYIIELKNIKLTPPKSSLFTPSKLWREVTPQEFFTGVPLLPKYIEENAP